MSRSEFFGFNRNTKIVEKNIQRNRTEFEYRGVCAPNEIDIPIF